VSIRLRPPSAEVLRSLLDAGRSDSLTYAPIGMSADAKPPAGYRLDRRSRLLGSGDRVFESAVSALKHWRVQEGAGLIVLAEGPPVAGSVVAMAAPIPLGYIDVVCQVVQVVDRPDRFGFTYGTLSVHPAQGEESFSVVRGSDDEVTFEIAAVSRPRQLFARTFPPIARRMQRAAMTRYLDAMQAEVAE
jgi:uncharacterized protein (UPF0548 family)